MSGRRLDEIQKVRAGGLTCEDYINSLTPEELANERQQSRERNKEFDQAKKEYKKEYNKRWSREKKSDKASTSSSSSLTSRNDDELEDPNIIVLNYDW